MTYEALQEMGLEERPAEAQEVVGLMMRAERDLATARLLQDKDEERAERKSMAGQSAKLLSLARKKGLPVLITSQVFMDIEKGSVEALGGNVLHHNAKTIVRLERSGIGRRRMTVMKHRHLAEGKSADIQLTESGIEC